MQAIIIAHIKKRMTRKTRRCYWIISDLGLCRVSPLRAMMEEAVGATIRIISATCLEMSGISQAMTTFKNKSWKLMRQKF
jgi:hypothetical protein